MVGGRFNENDNLNMQTSPIHLSVDPINNSASVYLDTLRLLFAQLVVIGHGASFFSVLSFLHPPNFPWIQSIAVVGFFWLSGFLICYSIIGHTKRNKNYGFLNYFIARFSRIYSAFIPSFLFVLIFDGLFQWTHPGVYGFTSSYDFSVAGKNLLMLHKFPIPAISSPMFGSGSTWWTLGIEWWMYMFFGWAILMAKPKTPRVLFYGVLLLFSIVPLNYALRGNAITGMGLSLVWFIATLFPFAKDVVNKYVTTTFQILFSFIFLSFSMYRYRSCGDPYDFIGSLYLGLFVLVSTCYAGNSTAHISVYLQNIIRFVAGYSFTLFLIHYSILYFVYKTGLLTGWYAFVCTFLVSNFVAAILAIPTEMQHKKVAKILLRFTQTRRFGKLDR
jgi:peptidoglycan/LPS O-acetylase OafA/YrhL